MKTEGEEEEEDEEEEGVRFKEIEEEGGELGVRAGF